MIGEFELIARLAPYLDAGRADDEVGHGDDAAVVRVGDHPVCVAVDALVEGRHFRRDLSSYADVGWKAVAVNCSDLAAMGATPTAAVVALCRPAWMAAEDVELLYAGMREAADRWGLRLVGGDTVAADQLMVSVTVLGHVDPGRAIRRSGATAGDRLVVVGALGAAAGGLALAQRGLEADDRLLAAHRRPTALVEAGILLARRGATAMIDVSDGLGADLGHICGASAVGARVDAAALPLAAGVEAAATKLGVDVWELACGGGEDFALLAALPPEEAEAAAVAAGRAEGVPASVIGAVTAYRGEGPVAVLELPDGSTRALDGLGYDHYGRQPA